MPRILGVDIPGKKKVAYSLRYIYGIGPARALEICEVLNIDPDIKADQLTDANIADITKILDKKYEVEGDLRRQLAMSIRRLNAIGCYRGLRHRRSLPCRGQRTKTNARTRKGRKRTVGAIRDKATRKMAK